VLFRSVWRGFGVITDPTNAWVAANTIDGQEWTRPAGQGYRNPDTGCLSVPSYDKQGQAHWDPQPIGGVEASGYLHSFYNNEIIQNSGGGMAFNQTPTGQLRISSANPSDPSDTPRYIEGNGFNGITFGYQADFLQYGGTTGSVQGVTLDAIFTRQNAGWGVAFADVLDNGTYTGFINGSCMSDNGVVPQNPPAGQFCGANDANVGCYSTQGPLQPSKPNPRDLAGALAYDHYCVSPAGYAECAPGIGVWKTCQGTPWSPPAVPPYSYPQGWPW
jgi:hypothetical protein